ncbi:hypothetical protein CDIK_2982 [Cucumispora dikerogammari]|nr:hypothetical protein CDIK_2982 [Cucumispora dikerogammari]
MFLLNQSFLFSIKRLVYKIDILNQHIYSLNCNQKNEQVKKDFRPASKRLDKIIEKLKARKHQSNNIGEYSLLATEQSIEQLTPVTYITETTQKIHENPIINYPPNNDNIFILKQNDQQVNREPFFYIEDTVIVTGDGFSNTTAYFEQTDTIQPLVSDNFEQVNKPIYCTPVETSFYKKNIYETPNNLTYHSFEKISPVKKPIREQSGGFNFLSPNEEGLYYPGKFEMEEPNLLTKHQTPQQKDVYKKQRLQPKSKRSSKEMGEIVMKLSDKKPKFNNEVKNKNLLKQNNISDDRQIQLNISRIDNQNKDSLYTVTMEHSDTHKQQKPDTYQSIEADNNQIKKQIEQDFSKNTDCNASNCTITNSQIPLNQAHNNRKKNIRNEFRLSPDQEDENIFKGIKQFDKNTYITAYYMKVPENTPVDGVREPTTCVKIDFKVNVTKSLKNEQPTMFLIIERVPMFLCAVSPVCSIDLKYKMNILSVYGHAFFVNIEITIIRPEVTDICVFNILPKFIFFSNPDFFKSDFYVNKIHALPFNNAEFEIVLPEKIGYSNSQHKKLYLKSKLARRRTVQHILSTLHVYKKAVENEIHKDSILYNAIKKLELLHSHLAKMTCVVIFEEEDFKRQMGQIIEFNKIFCKENDSSETRETGTPEAKNLKRAFLKALAWFKKYKCTFDNFYDNF